MMPSAMARICRALVPEQIRKWSVNPAALRRSSTTRSFAFLSSAAATAAPISFGSRVGLRRDSALAMQPACLGIRRRVVRAPAREHRRVKSVLFNMLAHAKVDHPGDRMAGDAALADGSG